MLSVLVLASIVALCRAAHSSEFDSGFVIDGASDNNDGDEYSLALDELKVHKQDHKGRDRPASDHDNHDSSSSRVHHNGRIQNRIDRGIEDMIQDALKQAKPASFQRQSYQARCARNATLGFNNVNDTAASRTVGPVLVLALGVGRDASGNPLAAVDPTLDSYDGNNDGQIDVLEARNAWQNSAANAQAGPIDGFIRALRNRATVNGGSVFLRSIVLSSRQIVHTKKHGNVPGNFNTFSATTILITPCFPLTTEPGYYIQLYAGGIEKFANATLLQSADIAASPLFNTTTDSWADSAGPFALNRIAGIAAGVTEGECLLQKCTQHSYFN